MPDRSAEYLALIHISDLANLGPDPRPSRLPRNELESQLESWCASRSIPDDIRTVLLTAALLWHDYLEDAHVLAQDIATTTGSFLHAIIHRREPDFNNACYWFHRVGRHECFYAIARAATPFLVKHGEAQLASRLLPNGLWNPFAFVEACAEVHRQTPAALNPAILRQLQRIELESLATDLLSSPGATGREP